MEDTLREEEKEGLNNLTLVLILVLMEDTLRALKHLVFYLVVLS